MDCELVQMERTTVGRKVANDDRAGGLDSYCHKQIGLWREFAVAAGERFADILGHPCGS